MLLTICWLHCIHGTDVADGTHQIPRSHQWHLSICPTVAPRLVSQSGRNTCQVCSQDASIGATVGQILKCQREYAEVWCVPSATHVPCIHWSQNKVLGVRVFVLLFLNDIVVSSEHWRHFPIQEFLFVTSQESWLAGQSLETAAVRSRTAT